MGELKGEKNGYVRDNELEGNFINGLKEGYIKEYYNGKLIF